MLHGEEMLFVSGTVEILFRTHTDAPRRCSNYLNPGGMQVTGYGRLPISGQNPLKLSSPSSVPLAKRVVMKCIYEC